MPTREECLANLAAYVLAVTTELADAELAEAEPTAA